jgi:hypothetical protein
LQYFNKFGNLGLGKNSFIPQAKFEMKIFEKKSFLKFEIIFFNFEKQFGHTMRGKWKKLKKIDFEI